VTAVYAAIAMIERAMEKIVATEGNDMNLPKKRPSPEKRDGIRLIDRGKAMPHKSSNRATSRRISSTGSGAEDSLAQR
jgi:hypothetical protein